MTVDEGRQLKIKARAYVEDSWRPVAELSDHELAVEVGLVPKLLDVYAHEYGTTGGPTTVEHLVNLRKRIQELRAEQTERDAASMRRLQFESFETIKAANATAQKALQVAEASLVAARRARFWAIVAAVAGIVAAIVAVG